MRRETTEEALLAIREQLHEISNVINQINLKVKVLWEEREDRQRARPSRSGDQGE